MNKRAVWLISLVAMLWTGPASAVPIYTAVFTSGPDTLTGSLETDGTTGALALSNIIAWSWTQTGPTLNFTISSTGPNPLFGSNMAFQTGFTATASTLTWTHIPSLSFQFLNRAGVSPGDLQEQVDFSSAGTGLGALRCLHPCATVSSQVSYPILPPYIFTAVTPPTTVPEPSTFGLLGVGLLGLGFMRRRRAA